MKFAYGLLVAAVALICASTNALPAGNPSDDVELVDSDGSVRRPMTNVNVRPVFTLVPISHFFDTAVAAAAGDAEADAEAAAEQPFHVDSISVPVNGHHPISTLDQLLGLSFVKRMNDLMHSIYGQAGFGPALFPSIDQSGGAADDTEDAGEETPALAESDGQPKTTSTIKIVNGHKYVINETISTRNTPFGQSIFKVRTVDILPLDADDADKATTEVEVADISTEAAAPKTTDATVGKPKDDDDEHIDRGSPEVLEMDSRRNEIGHRHPSERIEVLHV